MQKHSQSETFWALTQHSESLEFWSISDFEDLD